MWSPTNVAEITKFFIDFEFMIPNHLFIDSEGEHIFKFGVPVHLASQGLPCSSVPSSGRCEQ